MLIPGVDIRIKKISIHHFWIGLALFIGIYFLPLGQTLSLVGLAIGLGLIIDEFTFIILGGGSDKEYQSVPSLLGTLVIVGVIYFFREKIFEIFVGKF